MREPNSSRGIGLLELMLSILVITAVILGATKYYLVAKEATRVTQAQEIINNVAEAGYQWVEGQSDFSGMTGVAVLIKAGLLPNSYDIGKNISPWGGNVIVGNSGSGLWLSIAFDGLTITDQAKACGILQKKYGICGADSTFCATSDCKFLFRSP